MDHIFIKEEAEDTYDAGSASSASESYSSRSSLTSMSPSFSIPASSASSFPPTQRVLPSTLSSGRGLPAPGFPHFPTTASDEPGMSSKPPGLKRKCPEMVNNSSKHSRSRLSLMSPPLLPTGPSFQLHSPKSNIAMVPGYPQVGAAQDGGPSQEDEWKNIKVMLNCISGMVAKTQSAISILQQRQAEVANIRTAEDLVAEVQAKANIAIMEVKQAALEEIKHAKINSNFSRPGNVETKSKEESCWNCGRPAIETCSGCSLARYCGPFCQHKDWEDHSKKCRADLSREEISHMEGGVVGSPPVREA